MNQVDLKSYEQEILASARQLFPHEDFTMDWTNMALGFGNANIPMMSAGKPTLVARIDLQLGRGLRHRRPVAVTQKILSEVSVINSIHWYLSETSWCQEHPKWQTPRAYLPKHGLRGNVASLTVLTSQPSAQSESTEMWSVNYIVNLKQATDRDW